MNWFKPDDVFDFKELVPLGGMNYVEVTHDFESNGNLLFRSVTGSAQS